MFCGWKGPDALVWRAGGVLVASSRGASGLSVRLSASEVS